MYDIGFPKLNSLKLDECSANLTMFSSLPHHYHLTSLALMIPTANESDIGRQIGDDLSKAIRQLNRLQTLKLSYHGNNDRLAKIPHEIVSTSLTSVELVDVSATPPALNIPSCTHLNISWRRAREGSYPDMLINCKAITKFTAPTPHFNYAIPLSLMGNGIRSLDLYDAIRITYASFNTILRARNLQQLESLKVAVGVMCDPSLVFDAILVQWPNLKELHLDVDQLLPDEESSDDDDNDKEDSQEFQQFHLVQFILRLDPNTANAAEMYPWPTYTPITILPSERIHHHLHTLMSSGLQWLKRWKCPSLTTLLSIAEITEASTLSTIYTFLSHSPLLRILVLSRSDAKHDSFADELIIQAKSQWKPLSFNRLETLKIDSSYLRWFHDIIIPGQYLHRVIIFNLTQPMFDTIVATPPFHFHISRHTHPTWYEYHRIDLQLRELPEYKDWNWKKFLTHCNNVKLYLPIHALNLMPSTEQYQSVKHIGTNMIPRVNIASFHEFGLDIDHHMYVQHN
jgi:hypothetical protein